MLGTTNKEIASDALIQGFKVCFDPTLNNDIYGAVTMADATAPTAVELHIDALFKGQLHYDSVGNAWYYYTGSAWTALASSGVTMDAAYNGGSTVTVDAAAIAYTNAHASIDTLTITNSHATGSGDGLQVTMSGAGVQTGHGINIDVTSTTASGSGLDINCSQAGITGHCINLAHSGTGKLINSTPFTVSPAGAVVVTAANAIVPLTLTDSGTGNAITATNFSITKAGAATFASTVTVTTGGITVSAGGVTVTGDSTITGSLTVTGGLTFGGNWTVAATLTADEFIFDTDGVEPAGTNTYGVYDGTSLTMNVPTAKRFDVAINGADEYTFSATILDMNANALDNAGFIILNAATAPAATEVYAVNDNTGDLTLNALDTKEICLAVNGVDIVQIGTELELVSGTNLQFLGNDDIVDSGANELITFSATASAVNGFQVKNAATGARPAFGSNGASAEANIGLNLLDSNGNEVVELVATASATNGLLITNAATGDPVRIGANGTGATANRGIRLDDSNGNEALVLVSTASAVNEIGIVNTATTVKPIIRAQGEGDLGMVLANYDGTNTEEILILTAVATAVNEVTITSAATGAHPSIAATGGDANINLALRAKGTGDIEVGGATISGTTAAHSADTADGSLYLQSTTHATKGFVCIAAGDLGLIVGSDGSVDRATTVGTNCIHIFNGTAPLGALANGGTLYSAGGLLYAQNAAGTATQISPHSEDGDFIIFSYSAPKDKTIRIHLEKLLRKLAILQPELKEYFEETPGKKHSHEWN